MRSDYRRSIMGMLEPRQVELYRTNAMFKAQIDNIFESVLPLLVAGAEAESIAHLAEFERQMAAYRLAASRPLLLTKEVAESLGIDIAQANPPIRG